MSTTLRSPFLDNEEFDTGDVLSHEADPESFDSEDSSSWASEFELHEDEDSEAAAEFGQEFAAEADPVAELEGFDPASNEYEAIDPASNEYEGPVAFLESDLEFERDSSGAEYFDSSAAEYFDSSAAEFDGELFQQLVGVGPAVERALVSTQIAAGRRDPNELTNMVFWARHPSMKGQKIQPGQQALASEWIQIRDTIVRPALTAASGARSAGPATIPVAGNAPPVRLATLVCNVPGRPPFRYTFTSDDLLWTARFISGEAGGRDDVQNRAIIWTMFNRYAFFRNKAPGWGTFADFVRKYSTPLQPFLKKYEQVKKWVAQCNSTFDNPGCNYQPTTSDVYPGENVRKGQLKTFLELQRVPWHKLKESATQLATQALSGHIANPIGNASEFDDTAVYFQRKHGRRPTRDEWKKFTAEHAARKRLVWRPDQTPYDEFNNNVLFLDGRAQAFPPNATQLVRGGGLAPPNSPSVPAPSFPVPTAPPATGNPDRQLLYDGKTPAPGTVEARKSYPTSPPVTGNSSNRNRMRYDNIVNQFAVGSNPRHAKRKVDGKTSTYCNIFLWDVTRALGVEIPHWVDKSGNPMPFDKGKEMNANATNDWLHTHGARFGWRQLANTTEGLARVNDGKPVIASWKNRAPRGIGHVAVLRPGELTAQGPPIAQAGGSNFNNGRWAGLGRAGSPIELWTAD